MEAHAMAAPATAAPLIFRTRGVHRKRGYGLTYRSICGRYAVYKSYQAAGVRVKPVKWLAMRLLPREHIISDHRTREAAERACRDDVARLAAKGDPR